MSDVWRAGFGYRECALLANQLDRIANELRAAPTWVPLSGDLPTLGDLVVTMELAIESIFAGHKGEPGERLADGAMVPSLRNVVAVRVGS